MVAVIIGILMTLGVITSENEFHLLNKEQIQHYCPDWVGEDDGVGL